MVTQSRRDNTMWAMQDGANRVLQRKEGKYFRIKYHIINILYNRNQKAENLCNGNLDKYGRNAMDLFSRLYILIHIY